MESQLLRYRISDWNQLIECKSNLSKDLKIYVADFVQDERLSGRRIMVYHKEFGPLFACIVEGSGTIVDNTEHKGYEGEIEMSTDNILAQLRKFGYMIQYCSYSHLKGNQINFLITLNELKYDKIRVLAIQPPKGEVHTKVVAFNIERHPSWLKSTYVAKQQEFLNATGDGSAFCVSDLPQCAGFDWSWLVECPMSISDILESNSLKGV